MKKCFKCNKKKDLSMFYKHKQMKDGYLNKCKECNKKDSMKTLNDNRFEINKKRRLARSKLSGKYDEYSSYYRKEHLEKSKAAQAAYRAIKSGKIIRPSKCDNCNIECKPDAHHESYEKKDWLNLLFLCRSCHRSRHIELNKE